MSEEVWSYEDAPAEPCVYGFIGHDGEFVVPPKLGRAEAFALRDKDMVGVDGRDRWIKDEAYRTVRVDRRLGVADADGRYLIKPMFSNITSDSSLAGELREGYVRVAYEVDPVDHWFFEMWGLMTADGKVAVAPRFEYIEGADFRSGKTFSEGMARVMEGERFGFVECATGRVIPPVFDFVWPFSNGLACVRIMESQLADFPSDHHLQQYACDVRDSLGNKIPVPDLEEFRRIYDQAEVPPLPPDYFTPKEPPSYGPDGLPFPPSEDSDELPL